MSRAGAWGWSALCLVATYGCAQELRCSGGAVEINGVCECPEDTRYVRATATCEALDGAPGGGGTELSPPDAGRRDGATTADPLTCSADRIVCDGACVDPLSDARHCGGCAPCSRAGLACREGACVDVGCSDGTREAFVSLTRYPNIAGCAATWTLASMRAPRQTARCGHGAGACTAPADACAAGWHVCGNTGDGPADLTTRIGQQDCDAQAGRFAAALGDQKCDPCADGASSGAVCCGDDCVQQQGSCVWRAATAWFGVRNGAAQLCGQIENPNDSPQIGVMCCRDAR